MKYRSYYRSYQWCFIASILYRHRDGQPTIYRSIRQVPSGGWTQIVAFAGYYELFVYKYNGTPGPGKKKQGLFMN